MFFYRCRYKNSCFSEWRQLQRPCANLMICSLLLRFKKRCSYHEIVALCFARFVLKLYHIQVFITLPLWIKLTMGQLLLLFLSNYYSFFYLPLSCPSNQPFFNVIDWYILAIQQRNICDNLFDLQQSSELPQKR